MAAFRIDLIYIGSIFTSAGAEWVVKNKLILSGIRHNIFEKSQYLVVAGLTGPLLELVGEGGVAEAVVDQLDIAHFVVHVLPNHIRLPELKQVL